MKCNRQQLHKFIDGELCGEEKYEMERHIENCSSCRVFIDDVKNIRLILSESRQEAPLSLFDSVSGKLQPAFIFRFPLKIALGTAAAAALIFALLNISSPNGVDAEVEYYVENQMEVLFGQALQNEAVEEYDWMAEFDRVLFEEEL